MKSSQKVTAVAVLNPSTICQKSSVHSCVVQDILPYHSPDPSYGCVLLELYQNGDGSQVIDVPLSVLFPML